MVECVNGQHVTVQSWPVKPERPESLWSLWTAPPSEFELYELNVIKCHLVIKKANILMLELTETAILAIRLVKKREKTSQKIFCEIFLARIFWRKKVKKNCLWTCAIMSVGSKFGQINIYINGLHWTDRFFDFSKKNWWAKSVWVWLFSASGGEVELKHS